MKERETLTDRLNATRADLSEMRDTNESLQMQLQETHSANDCLSVQLRDCRICSESLSQQCNDLNKTIDIRTTEINRMQQLIEQINDEHRIAMRQRDDERALMLVDIERNNSMVCIDI